MAEHRRAMGGRRRSGQAAIEFTLLYGAVFLPLTLGIVYVAEMYWVWHSMAEFTREGARYAATHCWESDAGNVLSYMQTHVPVNIDLAQFQTGGSAQINILYYQQDPSSGQLSPFTCATGGCSITCLPDAVTVNVTNYEFRRFVSFLNLPPVVMPAFAVSMPIASNGCDPENPGTCNP